MEASSSSLPLSLAGGTVAQPGTTVAAQRVLVRTADGTVAQPGTTVAAKRVLVRTLLICD
jgi:archaeosine-15-forming tRNA-guanine transglycosylase